MTPATRPHNIAWLLAALALAVLPHVSRLPLWITLLCLGLGAWRFYASRSAARLPGKWLLVPLAGAAALGVFAHYGTLLGRDAGTALLIVMVLLKLLEIRTLRDSMLAIFLGYFLVITSFFHSQSVFMALYLLLAVLVLTAALIGLNYPGERLAARFGLRLAARLLVQAAPIMLLLFVLFPRVPAPLWGMPADAYSGLTGLGETMSPGSISRLSRSGAVAFRVAFDGPPLPPAQRYWRGPVLWHFDGRTWSPGPRDTRAVRIDGTGRPITYTVTLEPHDRPWLFALDVPASPPPGSRISGDLQLLSNAPVRQRLRYRVSSYPRYRAGVDLTARERERALRLPEHSGPRARALAREWRAAGKTGDDVIEQALAHFRNEPFVYTLTPPLLGADPIDGFLFETRRGFCEHFAGSFVFLMRAAGIPARVVTGYQGGELNPVGDYMIVRQSDAHAWAEVWLEGRGWVRVDPTAWVSPRRVESGIASALPEGEAVPVLFRLDDTWLRRLRLAWDAANNGWNQWVLGYGQERQYALLSRFGTGLASWKGMAAALSVSVGALLLAFAAAMLWQLRGPAPDPAVAAYRRFCDKLARRGIPRRPGEGPADYAERVARRRPDLAARARFITKVYIALRYGPRPRPEWRERLRRMVREFRP